jgi:aspartyl/glutamyl-tRNA(Asn/Gln) amidotransferase C subunit
VDFHQQRTPRNQVPELTCKRIIVDGIHHGIDTHTRQRCRVGNHTCKHTGIVVPGCPQLDRKRIINLDLLPHLTKDSIAHTKALTLNAMSGICFAGLLGAGSLELGEYFSEQHLLDSEECLDVADLAIVVGVVPPHNICQFTQGVFLTPWQLNNIIGFIEQLKSVNVSSVEATAHAVPTVNVTRADEVRPSISHEDALRNAPKQSNGLFIVPKIVE